MENSSECLEAKTPRRTRRSSGIELESATKKTRSTKSIKMPEIEETADASSDPKTPSKSLKQLEFRTPSKSEAMTLTQTPRRSVRKSIKPVQEYENIVAQKGLKRSAISTLDDNDQANEGKWVPAVIGRVSTKRSKKPGRGKEKNLKRQRRFTEDSEDNNEGGDEIKKNELKSDGVEVLQEDEKNTIIEEQLPSGMDAIAEKNDIDSEPNVQGRDELLPEENINNDHGHQNQEESQNKVIEVEQAALGNESVVEKGEIDSEHDRRHDSSNALNGDKLVEEINMNKIAKNQDDDVVEKENITSGLGPESCNVLHENKSIDEKQTEIEDIAKNQDDVMSETKLDLDKRQNEEEVLSVNSSEGGDFCAKSPSTEETASGNVSEGVDKKQINNVEEKEIELREKSVESTVEEPNHQKVDPEEVEEVIIDSLETSMEDGDVELVGMPITADDSMDSPKKETHFTLADETLNLKSLSAVGDENADDSDCIMLSLDESSNTVKSESASEEPTKDNKLLNDSTNSMDMPSLLVCSDDEEVQAIKSGEVKVDEAAKIPQADESSPLNNTFDAEQSVETPIAMVTQHTPVLRPSINHVPTPFKSKTPIIPDIIIEPEEDLEIEEPPTVVQESRETGIKSARKRSFSVCGDRPKRNVTFYSPANTTVSIYDDDLISSCRKADPSKEKKHRKRSLSVTETDKEMFAYIKQKRIADTPESNKKQPLSTSRTKMPNFSAIHQQQFKRMESISDHVARKAERAKILSNSALKAKPTSVQKGLPVKNSVLRDCNKDSKTANLPMPKARQRIELSGIEHKQKPEQTGWLNVGMKFRTKSRNDLTALDDLSSIDKLYKFNTSGLVFSGSSKLKLPKPRMDATVSSTSKTLPSSSSKTAVVPHITKTGGETVFNQANKPDSRPKFNLSTAPKSQSFRSTETLTDRRNRLMNMYKSRNHPRNGEKNREILKGVRTNRRFELQMMCRNRPN